MEEEDFIRSETIEPSQLGQEPSIHGQFEILNGTPSPASIRCSDLDIKSSRQVISIDG
jgi:hypothetical protein